MFGESRFSRSGRCGSFWQRGCGNFFAWFAGRTAPQCSPCDHSCWNVTNQKCNKPCGFQTNRTCDRTLSCLNVLGSISSDDFHSMMTSSNGNILRVTGPLCGKFTCHRWIPLTKASDMELWCFLWSATEQTFKQTIKTPVIWDAIALIVTSL